jgi:opacity protein-like surface antigen
MLANRLLLGAEVDATFPSFQNLSGISIGGTSSFTSPTLGPVSFSETVLSSGTVRGHVSYAPRSWLFYATGGIAWTYNRQTFTQVSTGNSETPFLWRLGWAAGAGIETPIAPHWTARLEYLFIDCRFGCEGIVSKRLGCPYHSGRVNHWLKIKNPTAPAAKREAEEDWGTKRWARGRRS